MKRYINGFNGLRTLGVLSVILYHLFPHGFRGGFLGVVLFFVLSGYLVTNSLVGEFERSGKIDVLGFYRKRIKRLYPQMITVFLVVTPYLLIFQQNFLQGLRANFLSSVFTVQNWWQISQGSSYFANSGGENPFKHIYYLSIEGQFFIVWPLIVFLLLKFVKSRFHSFVMTSVLTLISVVLMMAMFHPGMDPSRVYYGTDTRAFSLLIGASFAFIYPMNKLGGKVNKRGYKLSLQVTIGLLALLALAYFFMPDQSAFTYYGGMWLISLLSMLLIALVAHPSLAAGKIFSNKVFDYIGSRSYGIYLWQLPVFALAASKIVHVTAWYHVLWQLLLIWGLAELSYRFVEKPVIAFDFSRPIQRLKAFFTAHWKSRQAIVTYVIVALALFSTVMILASPKSPHDQQLLQDKILAQQKVLQEQQLKQARANVSASTKTIASKYGVDSLVAEKASKMKVLAVGDSVMVAGSADLQEAFPNMQIDAAVGRQALDGPSVLTSLLAKTPKPDAILIGLGTNGPLEQADIDGIMKLAGDKPVYWINLHVPTRPWESGNNSLIQANLKTYKNLHLVDWHGTSNGQTGWFYSDDIHPQGPGAVAYTKLVVNDLAG
ncbi:acyltransferase family protein [Lactococcus termiticola]|uniref:Acyltransferase n=1 Tax=Lactococcus termiticola TaxID=2169526 RepID=A0A2R5HJ37_9LACT|nr:acyltransferase family protein [Lactococcus termiticola]GBG96490.1 acyltransferase [Lactococcus termiticola]